MTIWLGRSSIQACFHSQVTTYHHSELMFTGAGAGSRSFGVTALSRQTMGSRSRVDAYKPDKFTGSRQPSMPGRCKSQWATSRHAS
ncbi:hypothetical protein NEUTE1DRAFT_34661 [Neurospora tetrasperma FGSC 2508]|uniref:Uncharacterized protein n=1 Tax=Neurospora tetrasperma (strain FGSC 2508 / ATCC MYA-4615 / P0657) TaxID=510951 RepID=F8MF74_NEUT8|nr:uncharacterized protein NEUTE1DRAFT_34661 [Neurospora tetrasperma FGSC 2508]EGO60928.1 hypothetical protein NEUTE1DRAFT_34661 [Neurospora tetrasperma FGSC 2508]EGZ75074.1 hypothetical protein NEUTE2DRAFT_55556 [Neurospora tetrasperma FGSC 2509]